MSKPMILLRAAGSLEVGTIGVVYKYSTSGRLWFQSGIVHWQISELSVREATDADIAAWELRIER